MTKEQRQGGRPAGFNHEEVAHIAMDVFWERGKSPGALAEIEERSGLKRSSLRNAFGSRNDLYNVALTHYTTMVGDNLIGSIETPDANSSAVDQLLSFIAVAENDSLRVGCFAANTLVEEREGSSDSKDLASRYYKRLAEALACILHRNGMSYDLAQKHAEAFTVAIIGLNVVAYVDDAYFDRKEIANTLSTLFASSSSENRPGS